MASSRYRIRDFALADDAGCKALELSGGFVTPKNPIGKALLRGCFTHAQAFDAKATQFSHESHVIVCEDTLPPPGEPAIVGVVMLGIKRVTLQRNEILLGYTFDLRVHEKAQRSGIGHQLCLEVEVRCLAAGVHTMYLSVNSDNERAKRLYAKLGFTHASKRAPQMSLLLRTLPTGLADDVRVVQLTAEAAAQVLIASHSGRDCALDARGVKELLTAHPAYETSFVCTSADGLSRASVHLWNGSHLGGFEMSRVLVPTTWLDKTPFLATVAAGATAALLLAARWLVRQGAAGLYLRFGLGTVGCAMLLFGVRRAAPMAGLIRRVLVNSNFPERRKRMRARLFGAACDGPDGLTLLAGLVQHARNEARRRGFDMCVLNMAADDPARQALGKASFYTTFLQKPLRPSNGAGGAPLPPPPPFEPAGFHDPRDIS